MSKNWMYQILSHSSLLWNVKKVKIQEADKKIQIENSFLMVQVNYVQINFNSVKI